MQLNELEEMSTQCSVGDADAVCCEALLERAKDVKSLLEKLSKHQSRSAPHHCCVRSRHRPTARYSPIPTLFTLSVNRAWSLIELRPTHCPVFCGFVYELTSVDAREFAALASRFEQYCSEAVMLCNLRQNPTPVTAVTPRIRRTRH